MRYRVYYAKPETFNVFVFGSASAERSGYALPTVKALDKTHVLLTEFDGDNPDAVFIGMQFEGWTARGAMEDAIKSRGLNHTSMTIGDVMVDEAGKGLMVDIIGYRELAA